MQLHLILVGLFFPLLVIIPLSGTAYLLGYKGEVKISDAFSNEHTLTRDPKVYERIFKEQNIDFDFEYIKDKGKYLVLRPSTRAHYEVHPNDLGGTDFKLVEPNLLKILQELHFGHGPKFVKTLQVIFGISFFFVILTGFILTFSLKGMGTMFFLSAGVGSFLFLLGFLL